jgi:hypothetical protein
LFSASAERVTETVLRRDATAISGSGLSLMPEGLEGAGTVGQMADFIAFLLLPRWSIQMKTIVAVILLAFTKSFADSRFEMAGIHAQCGAAYPELARARACENQVYLVSSTCEDVSPEWMLTAIHGRDGSVLAQATDWRTVCITEVDLNQRTLWPWLGISKQRSESLKEQESLNRSKRRKRKEKSLSGPLSSA